MIHNPFLPSAGDSKADDMVAAFTRQISTIYRKRFGLSGKHVEAIMNGEAGWDGIFFDCESAVKAGITPPRTTFSTLRRNCASGCASNSPAFRTRPRFRR